MMRKPPFYIMLALMAFAVFLFIMGILSSSGVTFLYDPGIFRPVFSLGRESSIPTWYNSIVLFILAVLTAIITLGEVADKRRFTRQWGWLSLIFLAMSMEEVAAIREFVLTARIRDLLHTSGIFYYAWVIPGMVLVLLFFVLYVNFILKLPRFVRLMFIIGAFVYVAGVIGVELLESYTHNVLPPSLLQTRLSQIIEVAEEVCEIGGVIILIYAMLVYIWEHSVIPVQNLGIFKRDFAMRLWQQFRIDIAVITVAAIAFFVGLGAASQPEYESLAHVHMGVGLPMDAPPLQEPVWFGEQMPFWGAQYGYQEDWNLVDVRIWWWVQQPPAADYSIGVYLLDSAGQLVAQSDGAINDLYYDEIQTSRMESKRIYLDERFLNLPPDVQAGTYQLYLAVYQWWDGTRLLLEDGSDSLYLGDVRITR
jgi:hypothetical protein